MTIEEIKRISLLDFMFSIGYSKIKSSGNKYWFLSPLHKETKASFKVDVNTNLWYDFGLNKGGNIINLVQLLNPELSMHNILEKLSHGNYTISNEVATVNRGLFINDKSAEAYIELKQQQLEEALENGDA